MQRGKIQAKSTNRLESTLKKHTSRDKPSRSRNQRHPKTSQTPKLTKDRDDERGTDTEAVLFIQNVLQVLQSASDSKERDLLNRLSTLFEKEQNLKKILKSKKENTPQDGEEQACMLQYVKKQQRQTFDELKIAMGQKKLEKLNQMDNREDMLKLYALVSSQSISEALSKKSQGHDLVYEISTKFEEQRKAIRLMSFGIQRIYSKIENVQQRSRLQSPISEKADKSLSSSSVCGRSVKKMLQRISQKINQDAISQIEKNKYVQQSPSHSSSTNELMLKILSLEKENLNLMKNQNQLEEDFECVVHEKFILEERLKEKEIANAKQANQLYDSLSNCRQEDSDEAFKKDIFQRLKSVVFQVCHLRQEAEALKGYATREQTFLEEISRNAMEHVQTEGLRLNEYEDMIDQMSNLVAAKELEINKYLKMIAKQSQQNKTLQVELSLANGQISQLQAKQQIMQREQMTVRSEYSQMKLQFEQQILEKQAVISERRETAQSQILKLNEMIKQIEERDKIKSSQFLTKLSSKQSRIAELQGKLKEEQNLLRVIESLEEKINHLQQKLVQCDERMKNKQLMIAELSCLLKNSQIKNEQLEEDKRLIKLRMSEDEQQSKSAALKREEDEIRWKEGVEEHSRIKNEMIEECGMLLEKKQLAMEALRTQISRHCMEKQDFRSYCLREFAQKTTLSKHMPEQPASEQKGADRVNQMPMEQNITTKQQKVRIHSQFKQLKEELKQFSAEIGVNFNELLRMLAKMACQAQQIINNWKSERFASHQAPELSLFQTLEIRVQGIQRGQTHTQTDPCQQTQVSHKDLEIPCSSQKSIVFCSPVSQSGKNMTVSPLRQASKSSFLGQIISQGSGADQTKGQDRNERSAENFVCNWEQYSLLDILNESNLSDSTASLKLELAHCIAKVKKLEMELKELNQKQMDRIFDF